MALWTEFVSSSMSAFSKEFDEYITYIFQLNLPTPRPSKRVNQSWIFPEKKFCFSKSLPDAWNGHICCLFHPALKLITNLLEPVNLFQRSFFSIVEKLALKNVLGVNFLNTALAVLKQTAMAVYIGYAQLCLHSFALWAAQPCFIWNLESSYRLNGHSTQRPLLLLV